MQKEIIKMLNKADSRKLKLIYFYIKAITGGNENE